MWVFYPYLCHYVIDSDYNYSVDVKSFCLPCEDAKPWVTRDWEPSGQLANLSWPAKWSLNRCVGVSIILHQTASSIAYLFVFIFTIPVLINPCCQCPTSVAYLVQSSCLISLYRKFCCFLVISSVYGWNRSGTGRPWSVNKYWKVIPALSSVCSMMTTI